MTPDLQRYYESRFAMMASDGWRDLMQDMKAMLESTDKASVIKDANDLYFRKGEISIMQWMLGLQEMSESAYKDLTNAKIDA